MQKIRLKFPFRININIHIFFIFFQIPEMFHSAAAYPDMTAVAAAVNGGVTNTNAYHQSAAAVAAASTPVYVPSSRALPHAAQYTPSAHFTAGAVAQNGWPTDGFSAAHTPLPHQFYTQNAVMMSSWRAYDPTGFQRTSPYG